MAEKSDTNLIAPRQQLGMTWASKYIVELQNVASTNLESPENRLKKGVFLQDRQALTPIWPQVHKACYTTLQPQYYLTFWIAYLLRILSYLYQVCRVKVLSIRLQVMYIHMPMLTYYLFLWVI